MDMDCSPEFCLSFIYIGITWKLEGNLHIFLLSKSTFSKNYFGDTISVEQFGPRSGPTLCLA